MRVTAAHCIPQFVDNMRGRGLIRITHAEIIMSSPRARSLLQLANDVENIRGSRSIR